MSIIKNMGDLSCPRHRQDRITSDINHIINDLEEIAEMPQIPEKDNATIAREVEQWLELRRSVAHRLSEGE